jgi:hypothetical protein
MIVLLERMTNAYEAENREQAECGVDDHCSRIL